MTKLSAEKHSLASITVNRETQPSAWTTLRKISTMLFGRGDLNYTNRRPYVKKKKTIPAER